MANIKISDMTAAAAASGTQEFEVNESGSTKKVTGAQIATLTRTVSGENITFADNDKAIFGTGSDLQIYHNGSNSYISDEGTGDLNIASNGTGVYINKGASENMAAFVTDGAVTLYYDNAAKFATTPVGADVTGEFIADSYN